MRKRSKRRSPRRRPPGRRGALLTAALVTVLIGGGIAGGVLMTASAKHPGAGTYTLVNAASGECLEVPGDGISPGAALGQGGCDGAADQTWKLTKSGSDFTVTAAHSGLCAGVEDASTTAGKAVQQQTCTAADPSQTWTLTRTDGGYHLVNARSAECLSAEGTLVQQNSCDSTASKSWTLKAATAVTAAPVPTSAGTSTPRGASTSPSASPSISATARRSGTPSASAPATKKATASTSAVGAAGAWPTAVGTKLATSTIEVSGTYDGGLKRFRGSGALGTDDQSEDQKPIFELKDGAVLKNVIIGAPAADGVHCLGSCTLQNVWWEDVGEDAATFKGTSASATYLVSGGGAKGAEDKVLQFNGAGTLTVRDFRVADFGKLVRSCGNCETQHTRHIVVSGVTATSPGKVLVGINSNYGDTAQISGVTIVGDAQREITVCERFKGNDTGAEPTALGSGPDGTNCLYSAANIAYRG